MSDTSDVLRGPHVLEYPYKRSLGPVLSRFFTSLRDRQFEGIKSHTGKVLVPPQEYDPDTGKALSEWVPVGPGGEIVSWSWVSKPRAKQPLDHPFAYALIRLDGADVPLLHAVDARDESKLAVGARVVPRWAAQPKGGINDVVCFDLEGKPAQPARSEAKPSEVEKMASDLRAGSSPTKAIVTPIRLEYDFTAGRAATQFLRGLEKRKILGARSGPGQPVLVPPRGADPRTSELAQESVEVSDKGTVVTYSVIRVPSENIKFELPYVCINVLLDGASIGFFHVLQKCPLDRVRIGMRVRAKWAPDDKLAPSVASIEYFEPIDEPDVPYEKIKENT